MDMLVTTQSILEQTLLSGKKALMVMQILVEMVLQVVVEVLAVEMYQLLNFLVMKVMVGELTNLLISGMVQEI